METIKRAVLVQNEEIEIFSHDTPTSLADMVVGEAEELRVAIREAYATDDLTEVASEIGDVFYLMIRLCDEIGIPFEDTIKMKIARNLDKYKGQPDTATAKENWKLNGGDGRWFLAYLDTIAEVKDEND